MRPWFHFQEVRTKYNRLMERAVSRTQCVCASTIKLLEKGNGVVYTTSVLGVASCLLHCPALTKTFEGIQRLEERGQHIQHEIPTRRVQGLIIVFFDTDCKAFQSSRKRTGECYLLCCVSNAISAYAPCVPGLTYTQHTSIL